MASSTAQCFKLLGLTGHENLDEVRGAYRRIARQLHPDRNDAYGDGERFKQITAAYNQLVRTLRGAARSKKVHASDTIKPATWKKTSPDDVQSKSTNARSGFRWGGRQEREPAKRQSRRYGNYSTQGRSTTQRSHGDAHRYGGQATEEPTRRSTSRAKNRPVGPERPHQNDSRASSRRRPASPVRPRSKTVPPADADIEQAWQDWCEKTKNYQSARRVETPSVSPREASPSTETETLDTGENDGPAFGRLRRWLKRNFERFSVDTLTPVGGEDIKLRMLVNPSLIVNGGQQRIAVRRFVKCPSCDGRADVQCVCGGHGRIRVREVIEVDVKAGAVPGAHVRISEKGSESLDGGVHGDLVVFLEPLPIPDYRRDGTHLHGGCTISSDIAAHGGVVKVQMPRGRVKINVPKNTRSGDRFRLKGQGLDQWQGDGRGDAYLTVKVA